MHDDTVSDDVHGILVEDSRRDEVKCKIFPVVVVDGVSRVRSSLASAHDIVRLCEHVNEFPFSLITPLRSQNTGHLVLSCERGVRREVFFF